MANKFTYDTDARLFKLNVGVTQLDAKTEFYSAAKFDWRTDNDLNRFRFPIESIGGQSIGGGLSISPYYLLRYGWRLQFAPADQYITITGNIITDEGDGAIVENPGDFHHQAVLVVTANSLTVGEDGGGGSGLTAAEIWDLTDGIEATMTPREALRLIVAASAGKLSGADGTQVSIRDVNDSKDRIVATVDEHGNRIAVTTDAT